MREFVRIALSILFILVAAIMLMVGANAMINSPVGADVNRLDGPPYGFSTFDVSTSDGEVTCIWAKRLEGGGLSCNWLEVTE